MSSSQPRRSGGDQPVRPPHLGIEKGSPWLGNRDLAIAKIQELNSAAGFDEIVTTR